MTLATTEPLSFRAGDLLTWEKDLSPDYPANGGWALVYSLVHPTKTKITITAAASGAKFLVSVAAAVTAVYGVGQYQWIARVTKTTEIYTVGQGTIEILPDLAALTTYDFRSHARTMLDALEAAYEGTASSVQLEYEIHGRRLVSMSKTELIKWRNYYKAETIKEQQAEQLATTGINPRRIGVRFRRV
jgi:hypothetical protein